MSYEKVNWENEGDQNEKDLNAENLGHMDEGIYNLQNVELIAVTNTAPTTCATGDKYFNTTTNKIYTATAENTWGATGTDAVRGIFYIVVEETTTYYYNGTTLVSVGGGSGSGSGGSDLIGTVKAYAGETVPENKGYLLCQGQAISRSTYSDLFALIGTTFGVGDGSTTFNLPNLKGRTIVGLDILDTDFNVIGKTGGEKAHTLTIAEMPSHSHDKTNDNLDTRVSNWDYGTSQDRFMLGDTGYTISTLKAEGGNQPHNNLQPYMALNYIIKAYETTPTQAEVVDSMDGDSTTNAPSVHAVKTLVEHGSNSNGYYEKYADGTLKCWGKVSKGTVSIATSFGALFVSSALTYNDFPINFIAVPVVTKWVVNGGSSAWLINGLPAASVSNCGGVNLVGVASGNATNVDIMYMAVGRWKE